MHQQLSYNGIAIPVPLHGRRTRSIGSTLPAYSIVRHTRSIAQALTFMPSVELDDEESRRAGHGQAVEPRAVVRPPAWTGPGSRPEEVLMIHDREAVAIAKDMGETPGVLKPVVGFRG